MNRHAGTLTTLALALAALAGSGRETPAEQVAAPLPDHFLLVNAQRYCEREPAECVLPEGPVEPVSLDDARLLLASVNAEVNARFRFRLDSDQYGVSDYWTVPQSQEGDCEDFALAKRRMLIDAGVDPRNLRIALVFMYERGKRINHALLGVDTDKGMRFLDMNTQMVADRTAFMVRFGYQFHSMQTSNDFAVYARVDDPGLPVRVAGQPPTE